MKDLFKLCVRCYTYNQLAFIGKCLDGFCMQKTSIPFVCAVVDDASTDGTVNYIRNYLGNNFVLLADSADCQTETDDYVLIKAKNKENENCFFYVYLLKYNHYSKKKSKLPYLDEHIGNHKYIAYCEGDDYWIDPLKVQKQVNYMESHQECSYLFTDRYIDHEKLGFRQEIRYQKNKYSKHDILSGFIPGLQTVMFRRELQESSILQTKGINGDRLYAYAASTIGEVHCLHEITAVYRNTGKGVSTSVSQDAFFNHVVSDMMRFHRNLNEYDWMAYCKGQSKNLGTYGAGLPKWKRLFGVYAAFRRIDNRISFLSFLLIFSFYIKNIISTRFNFNDPKEYNVR